MLQYQSPKLVKYARPNGCARDEKTYLGGERGGNPALMRCLEDEWPIVRIG